MNDMLVIYVIDAEKDDYGMIFKKYICNYIVGADIGPTACQ